MAPATFTPAVSYAERRRRSMTRVLVLPATLWLVAFFLIPLVVIVAYSFLTPSATQQARLPATLDNYIRLAKPEYTSVLWRSLTTAIWTTLFCLLIGYPVAFFIATRPKKWRNIFLLLVVIPFWTNFLVRTYAWLFILSSNGLINSFLPTPVQFINTPGAVLTGLIYGNLPFMILPIYTTVEKFNFRLVEAVHDLGGNDWRAFWRVVLPLTLPGVVAGCILVFIPSIGAFVTPDLLGGADALMIGAQTYDFIRTPTGKPFGSALSVALMAIVSIMLVIYFRFSDRTATPI